MNSPIVRLELDHMKQTMLVALSDYQVQITEEVERQLDNTIANFDYAAIVGKVATDIITAEIGSYLSYGEGRQIIRKAIEAAFDKLFKDPEVKP